jgi:hypothetical protein
VIFSFGGTMQHQSTPRVATQFRGLYAMSATIPAARAKPATTPDLKLVTPVTTPKKATEPKR